MKKIFFILVLNSLQHYSFSQSIGIGTSSPASSAILDVNSTTKGTLITRMTTVQRKGIANAGLGLLVYDTDKKTVYMFDGGEWRPLVFGTSESVLPPTPFTANDAASGDEFGLKVDIDGDYAIVGSPNHDIGMQTEMGAAYIFKRTDGIWIQQAKLTSADFDRNKLFGSGVSISGEYAIVGAPGDSVGTSYQGSAYIFKRNGDTWAQQAKIISSDGSNGDGFGSAVAIDGSYAVVGAPQNDVGTHTNRGSAYVFIRSGTTWTQQSHLGPIGGISNDAFGSSVDISGSYIIVGAPYDDGPSSTNRGCAYIFSRVGSLWSQQAQLIPSYAITDTQFGYSVSISGSSVIIGNPITFGAFVFVRNGSAWTEQAMLADIVNGLDANGTSYAVSISGDIATVADPGFTVNGIWSQGRVWVYKRNGTTWILVRIIDDGNPHMGEYFGRSVSISNGDVIIGASHKNSKGEISITNVN
jgi:hypothetical protein